MKTSVNAIRHLPMRELQRVRSLAELDVMVKESEIATGSGRIFVVAGADRPAYQVDIIVSGFCITRLDGLVQHQTLANEDELGSHPIGNALECGLLYTEPLLH